MRSTSVLIVFGTFALAQGCVSGDKEAGPQKGRRAAKESEAEGSRILREFQAGQRRLPAGDGSSYLIGKMPGPCTELPAVRPPGFQINYSLLDGEAPDRMPPRFAFAENECEVIWSHLHLGKLDVRCTLFAAGPINQLYRELRKLAPHTIETRAIDASPHRGGYAIEWHWPGHACAVRDSGDTEVVPEDDARFRAMVDWLVGACMSAGNTHCR
jgi:hypothetical protein